MILLLTATTAFLALTSCDAGNGSGNKAGSYTVGAEDDGNSDDDSAASDDDVEETADEDNEDEGNDEEDNSRESEPQDCGEGHLREDVCNDGVDRLLVCSESLNWFGSLTRTPLVNLCLAEVNPYSCSAYCGLLHNNDCDNMGGCVEDCIVAAQIEEQEKQARKELCNVGIAHVSACTFDAWSRDKFQALVDGCMLEDGINYCLANCGVEHEGQCGKLLGCAEECIPE